MDDFSYLLYVRELPDVEVLAAKLSSMLEADGVPEAAVAVRASYFKAIRELESFAKTYAADVTAELRAEEIATRVRPDTGGDGGTRLGDSLEAEPIPSLPGTVGFANETKLYGEVPWWWTNEEGYGGNVGHEVHGHFYGSGYTDVSDPGAAASRTHPLFVAEGGPVMTIGKPIPARRFIERTIEKMAPAWHARVAEVRERMNVEWQAAINVARQNIERSIAP